MGGGELVLWQGEPGNPLIGKLQGCFYVDAASSLQTSVSL